MTADWLGRFERLAETGTAPDEGCAEFAVGSEDALGRLKKKYLLDRFARGLSSEKFITGPYGSGKTFFLRQVLEMARTLDCVTAEVCLNRDLDFTQNLLVYQEVAREIRAPGQDRGIQAFLTACMEKVASRAPGGAAAADLFLDAWIAGLDANDLELEPFGRVARHACEAAQKGPKELFAIACRWLGGEMADRQIAKELREHVVSRGEQAVYGRRALLSLLQLARRAGFRGTVFGFDEAEQSLDVDARRMQRILSMLQSGINAVSDLANGSALLLYAVTPRVIDRMEEFPALQQRVVDAGPGMGFFDGFAMAPKIDLTRRLEPIEELRAIGERLVIVFFERVEGIPPERRDEALREVARAAEDVASREPSSSARRSIAKRTCAYLLMLRDETWEPDPVAAEEPEV